LRAGMYLDLYDGRQVVGDNNKTTRRVVSEWCTEIPPKNICFGDCWN